MPINFSVIAIKFKRLTSFYPKNRMYFAPIGCWYAQVLSSISTLILNLAFKSFPISKTKSPSKTTQTIQCSIVLPNFTNNLGKIPTILDCPPILLIVTLFFGGKTTISVVSPYLWATFYVIRVLVDPVSTIPLAGYWLIPNLIGAIKNLLEGLLSYSLYLNRLSF